MNPKRSDDLTIRMIKSLSDILIIKYLKTHPLSSGYEILRHLQGTYKITFSPGTIYHEIYMLERYRMVKSEGDDNGRIYSLTEQGQKKLTATIQDSKRVQEIVAGILSEN